MGRKRVLFWIVEDVWRGWILGIFWCDSGVKMVAKQADFFYIVLKVFD